MHKVYATSKKSENPYFRNCMDFYRKKNRFLFSITIVHFHDINKGKCLDKTPLVKNFTDFVTSQIVVICRRDHDLRRINISI